MKSYFGFNIEDDDKLKYSFKRYPFIPEEEILKSLLLEIEDNDLPNEYVSHLREAWNSRFWVIDGYDGSTKYKDKYEPRLAPFLHDYHYRHAGLANFKTDWIFKKTLQLTGSSDLISTTLWSATITFGNYFKIGHYIKGNVKKPSDSYIKLYNKLKTIKN